MRAPAVTGPPIPARPDRRADRQEERRRIAKLLGEAEEIEVWVEKLVAGGEGLARFEGVPIFVPRSAPGDRLRVRLVDRKADYGRATIEEILEPGAGRREPPCPFFKACGGCDLQHLDDALQSKLKAEAVRETLERLGRLELPAEIEVVTGDAWGYRLRTQLHAARPAARAEEGGPPVVGYHRRGSHEVVAIDRCPILVPELETLLPSLPSVLSEDGPRRLDLAAGEGGEVTTAPVVAGLPHGEVILRAAGFAFAFDARTFFQGHRGLLETLIERVVDPTPKPPQTGSDGDLAFDLYAGVGLFTLPLAARHERVVAVEGDRVAARHCRNNLRRNRVRNAEVEARAVETWIARRGEDLGRADRIVVDPPRGGLARPVRNALLHTPPRRLTYVSCHPAALARDLRFLARVLRLEGLCLLDLFPQTGHMEAVVQLKRLP